LRPLQRLYCDGVALPIPWLRHLRHLHLLQLLHVVAANAEICDQHRDLQATPSNAEANAENCDMM
jgi:hypothetical protein